MKIQKTELATKLNQIKGVVPKKTTMPILQGILVKEGYLIANNLEMTVKAKLEGTEGECFIIPERAFDLINNLPDGEVDISVSNGNTMTIRADKIKNKYQTMDPEPFPVADIDGEGSEFSEMFGRSTAARKQNEKGMAEKDYKAALLELFSDMNGNFQTKHKRYVAERYRNFFMSVSAIADNKDCKAIYEGLISGDPKLRSYRALYQRIYGKYITEAKKKEGMTNG